MPRFKEIVYLCHKPNYIRKNLDEKIPSDDLEKSWIQLTGAHNQTAKAALGTRKGQSKPWISASTWKAIEERKKIKVQMN